MANVNKVILIGRLTQDPELRHTTSQVAVTDLRLAVNRTYGPRDGEQREETLYIDVTVWNQQAKNCCQYLRKGRQVYVEGFLRQESWEDKATGQQRSKIRVQADVVQFLDGGGRRDDAGGDSGSDESVPESVAASGSRGMRTGGDAPGGSSGGDRTASRSYGSGPTGAAPASRGAAPSDSSGDDDIPF